MIAAPFVVEVFQPTRGLLNSRVPESRSAFRTAWPPKSFVEIHPHVLSFAVPLRDPVGPAPQFVIGVGAGVHRIFDGTVHADIHQIGGGPAAPHASPSPLHYHIGGTVGVPAAGTRQVSFHGRMPQLHRHPDGRRPHDPKKASSLAWEVMSRCWSGPQLDQQHTVPIAEQTPTAFESFDPGVRAIPACGSGSIPRCALTDMVNPSAAGRARPTNVESLGQR